MNFIIHWTSTLHDVERPRGYVAKWRVTKEDWKVYKFTRVSLATKSLFFLYIDLLADTNFPWRTTYQLWRHKKGSKKKKRGNDIFTLPTFPRGKEVAHFLAKVVKREQTTKEFSEIIIYLIMPVVNHVAARQLSRDTGEYIVRNKINAAN